MPEPGTGVGAAHGGDVVRGARRRGRTGGLPSLIDGESVANAAGLFTGVLDVALSERGRLEALRAAELFVAGGAVFDRVFSSELARATETARIVMQRMGFGPGRIERDWRLNERSYGALMGRAKHDVIAEEGHEQFVHWRRSLHGRPPAMTPERQTALRATAPFSRLLPEAVADTESLGDVIVRVEAVFAERIRPALAQGGDVLVVAHGNSLRALCLVLDHLSEAKVAALNLPTGHPLRYRFASGLRVVERGGRYLDEPAALAAAAQVAREGGT